MIGRLRFSRLGPVAASVLAGFLGAGLADAVATLLRAPEAGGPGVFLLAIGLYGAAGLLAACMIGLLVAGLMGAVPGGLGSLAREPEVDRSASAGLLSGAVGVLVIAIGAAAGQKILIRAMQSDKLATIASAGLVLMGALPAAAVAIGLFRPVRAYVVPRLPRPARVGTTGLLLLLGGIAGVLATVAAFSRADWRVLDLSPFVAFALVMAFGVGHGLFWYRSALGRRLAQRVPSVWVSHLLVLALFVAFGAAARLNTQSPAFAAAEQGSLGLRFGLRVARALSDGDGDGFSARFGGGDCDDHRADVYPGAEDVPGNGVDENCEGGDAVATAEDDSDETDEEQAAPAAPEHGAKAGPDKGGATKPGTPAGAGAGSWKGNILIITIDAFRADRLGVAGYGRPAGKSLTPNLDALAHRGAYFRRVWAQAPNTPRSFPAILTSQPPSGVHWDKPHVNYPDLLPSNHTFFEDLRAAGLDPIGVFSHFYFTSDRGISKGFKDWTNDNAGTIAESNKDSASPRIVPRVIGHLKKAAASHERFVLWTHLFEPHSSYMTHKEFPTSGATGVPGLMEKYDYEIAFADLWVGKLLKSLDALGLAKNTAIVVMADHGEAWSEHKAMFHGTDLYDEQLRIPLIIAVPGREPVVINDDVAAIDVAPTLVDLVGAPVPRSFRGRSLLPALAGEKLPPRPIFSELMPATAWPHHATMLLDGDKKLIHRITERRYELYDLAADPGEKKNLVEDPSAHATFERMKHTLLNFEERRH
jgi:arylsulfatase A-like enzyme